MGIKLSNQFKGFKSRYIAKESIRARLLIGLSVWVVFAVLATGWVLTDLFDNYSKRQLASELNVQMNQLLAAFNIDNNDHVSLDFSLNDPRFNRPLSGLYWQIDKLDQNGNYTNNVLRSRSLWDQNLILPKQLDNNILFDLPGPKETELLASVKQIKPAESSSNYFLIIAIDQDVLDPVTHKFNLMVALFLGGLAITMIIALIVQIWLGLKPLVSLQQKLEQVLDGSVKQIDGAFPSEIQPLVNAFNRVLTLNETMVEQARAQAGNLAHVLKTPLTIISNSVNNDESKQGQLIKEQIKSAQHHVNHHLAKARATAIGVTQNKSAHVQPLVAGLVRTFERLYSEKHIKLHYQESADDIFFVGEANDLQEMLGNLIDNAYKWTTNNIWLAITVDNNQLIFTIEDDGKGLSNDQQTLLFKRGVRLDEQTPGTGLGLAIVNDLAIAYGGNIETQSSQNGGLKVILKLPAKLLTNTHK